MERSFDRTQKAIAERSSGGDAMAQLGSILAVVPYTAFYYF